MKTIAFFNNKGGVGKTTLCYHLAHMLSRLGLRVLAVDLDPQANLTAYFCTFEEIEEIWAQRERAANVSDCLAPLTAIEPGPVSAPELRRVADRLALLPGNIALSGFEDELSNAWLQIRSQQPGSYIRVTIAFWALIQKAAADLAPDVVLVDVGPNLGAITRASLLATDYYIVPLTADVFSLQGLRNLGPTVRAWSHDWSQVREEARRRGMAADLPEGQTRPAGYVMLQHAVRKNRPVRAYQHWFEQVPATYREAVLGDSGPAAVDPSLDANCLGDVRHYQSLVPLSQDANKPMFDLTAADGAIGAHLNYVRACYDNFRQLALRVAESCSLGAGASDARLSGGTLSGRI